MQQPTKPADRPKIDQAVIETKIADKEKLLSDKQTIKK